MSAKQEALQMINTVEASLLETEQAANGTRGVLSDVANLVIPMQRDQLAILRKLAENLPD